MKLNFATCAILCLFGIALAACSKLDAPQPGEYRAAIELKGGDVPVQLQIAKQNGQIQLALLSTDAVLNATQVSVQNGELHAVLPNRLGELHATFNSKGLKGDWQLLDSQGKSSKLPFTAQWGAHYRFIDKSVTDNADVTGYWELDHSVQLATQHSAPNAQRIVLNVKQTHDAVDGVLAIAAPPIPDASQESSTPAGQPLTLLGQVHGDDVYLSAIGAGQIVLLKGKVNAHGDLEGKLWVNSGDAQPWVAKRNVDQPALDSVGDGARQVAFPSAVPLP